MPDGKETARVDDEELVHYTRESVVLTSAWPGRGGIALPQRTVGAGSQLRRYREDGTTRSSSSPGILTSGVSKKTSE
jgi:hypothetical protein